MIRRTKITWLVDKTGTEYLRFVDVFDIDTEKLKQPLSLFSFLPSFSLNVGFPGMTLITHVTWQSLGGAEVDDCSCLGEGQNKVHHTVTFLDLFS